MSAVQERAMLEARAAGVTGLMLAGVCPSDWRAQIRVSRCFPECSRSYGIHPQWVVEQDEKILRETLLELERALRGEGYPRPRALGEIGLDYANGQRKARAAIQKSVFRSQLCLARELNLPVLLHILKAHGSALDIIKRDGLPERGGVVHSYSGSKELVREYEALGLYISFAGLVCQPKARRLRAAVPAVSIERLLVETDAPDQTPLPHQPGPNQPAFLVAVVESIAELRAQSAERIAARTDANARRLFGL